VKKLPEFCEVCGSIMRVKKKDNDEISFVCPICGWEKTVKISMNNPKSMEVASIVVNVQKPSTEIIDESKLKPRGVLVDKICPKCGHSKAYVVVMQTRAADEPPTRIYHCEKCGYTWREYS